MSGVGNLFPPATRHRIGDPRSHDDNDVTRSGHNAQPRNVRSAIAVVRILPATIASACRALRRVPAGPPAPRTVMHPRMPTHVHPDATAARPRPAIARCIAGPRQSGTPSHKFQPPTTDFAASVETLPG